MEQFFLQFFGLMEAISNFIVGISHEDIGFISTVFLALCSLPLFIQTVKQGHCKNISGWFLSAWFIGDATGVIYVIPLGKIPLIANYVFNFIMVSTMLIYKIRKG